jgi:hypothetical protein
MIVKLDESKSVTLDGTGKGTAKIGPLSAREIWHPARVHVSANSNPVNEATCTVYTGDTPTASNFRDETFTGSSGDTTDAVSADIVKCGTFIFAVWAGGDAGVVATMNVTGSKEV